MGALIGLYTWYNVLTFPIGIYLADKKGMLKENNTLEEKAKATGYILTWQYVEGYKLLKRLKNKKGEV